MKEKINELIEKMESDSLQESEIMENIIQYIACYKETKFEKAFNEKSLIKFKFGTLYFCPNCGIIPPF
jgi:hypothetical protein